MKIRFYGVRGSCPTPMGNKDFQEKVLGIIESTLDIYKKAGSITPQEIYNQIPVQYGKTIGGNTTCLYLQSQSGQHCIFDMGTGIRELGNQFAKTAFSKEGIHFNIFMTHTHWDHIQGWPFFKPAYSPYTTIHFYSTIPDLKERLERQQRQENFPVPLEGMASQKTFTLLEEFVEIQVGDLYFMPFSLKHPGACTGYRIREGTKTIVFATDVEFRKEDNHTILRLKEKIGGMDLLIIDAQYSTEEAEQKIGWGHTAVKMAVDVAEMCGAKKVVLTHHEPDHNDEKVFSIIDNELKSGTFSLEVIPAIEGMELEV